MAVFRLTSILWLMSLVLTAFAATIPAQAQNEESAAEATESSQDESHSDDSHESHGEAEKPKGPKPLPAIGYVDSPYIPGTPWRVHDINRPRPPIVQVAPAAAPQAAPSDAIVLFDGKDLSRWCKPGKEAGQILPAGWNVKDDYMEVEPGSGSIRSIDTFGDMQLHIEWSAPTPAESSSQGRGNSGVIIMGRYEIQVLDSYENTTYADGQAAAVYGQYPPAANVTRPPGDWNVYDIIFKAPRFEDDELVSAGYVTVFHNGVLMHYHRKLIGPVGHRAVNKYKPHSPAGPLHLQDHGNKTRFRNIWVRHLDLED